MLERKGISNEVVANTLRNLASQTKSSEVEVDSLKVRLLNGCYGSLPSKPSVSTEDTIQLKNDLALSDNGLNKICKWMRNHGLMTPNPPSALDALKIEIEDLFTEDQIVMQHRAKLHEEDEKYVEKETEIIYCNDIPELIQRTECKRLINTEHYRWCVDHGKGFLKVVLQPTYNLDYVDSVKGCLLVAVTNAPETRENFTKFFQLIPTLDLTDPKTTLTSDLKVISMICGLRGGAEKYPSP